MFTTLLSGKLGLWQIGGGVGAALTRSPRVRELLLSLHTKWLNGLIPYKVSPSFAIAYKTGADLQNWS